MRVLCVDDNFDVADSEALLLTMLGFETCACYGGAAALDAAPAFRPDVCLIDLNMPLMNGDELALRIREQAAGDPIVLIAVTARSDEASTRRICDAGFHLHLVKPVDPALLTRILKQFE